MAENTAERAELKTLVLPRRGLEELLRGWSSDGQVFDALSSMSSEGTDVEWSTRDIQRRAGRVLLGKVEDELRLLPETPGRWREYLPVTMTSARAVSSRLVSVMDWSATARRYGWPPRGFVGHPRSRTKDETPLQVLAWVARKLEDIMRSVRPVAKLLVSRTEPHITAITRAVSHDLADVAFVRPDRLDIRALSGSGAPWSILATIAELLVRAETDLEFLAFQLIEPIPELEWRLFHLSVMGEVLLALRGLGGRVRWNAPLNASQSLGPQFQVTLGQDSWDLWFEASAASRHYRVMSPYRTATAGIGGTTQPIGADVMLCLPGKRALTLECKWSSSRSYVSREGYHQISSYLIEVRSGIASHAWSYVVGPEEVVNNRSDTRLDWPGGTAILGMMNVLHVADIVREIVTDQT